MVRREPSGARFTGRIALMALTVRLVFVSSLTDAGEDYRRHGSRLTKIEENLGSYQVDIRFGHDYHLAELPVK